MNEDIAIDLYCGLGGWAEGLLAENFSVIGFDIERHDYGTGGYPGQLVLQDVLSITGAQLKPLLDRLRVIVASPPCTEPSYRAMPWKRAKALNEAGPPHTFIKLFQACFRIQREASEAAGRHIPLIVENVVGAQRWVGRAQWHFGSYYLWGDIPALMPMTMKLHKVSGFRFDGSGRSFQSAAVKTVGHANKRDGHSHTRHLTNQREHDGVKVPGIRLRDIGFNVAVAREIDASQKPSTFKRDAEMKRQHLRYSRKAASAMIAKIPFPLARHIAHCFKTPIPSSSQSTLTECANPAS